jgi:uncharacterized cupin superfamily protein
LVVTAEVSINDPQWDMDDAGPPWHGRVMRVGARAGAREIGASLYEMDPGGALAPYHLHHGNEELMIVLCGSPLLRTPSGYRRLVTGATVAFARGPRGAHRVSNPGPQAARVLIFSTMHFPDVAEHPDTGTVLAVTGPGEGQTFPRGSEQPFIEVYMRAMDAARDLDTERAGVPQPADRGHERGAG